MNFLAYLLLAGRPPVWLAGGLLGDFVRGRLEEQFTPGVRCGIELHRHIDGFTDRHPIWKQSRARLNPARRRCGGIIVDVLYDHFLTRHWSRFADGSLREFLDLAYEEIWVVCESLALEAQTRRVLVRMRCEDWLGSYGRPSEVASTLHRISLRSPVLAALRDAAEQLQRHYAALESDFLMFYPELVAFADGFRANASLPST